MHNRLRAHNKLLPPFSRESTFKRKNLLLFGILFSLQCLKLVLRENKNKTKRKHVTRLKSLKVLTEAATMTPVKSAMSVPVSQFILPPGCVCVCVCVCRGGGGGCHTVDIPPPQAWREDIQARLSCLPVFFLKKIKLLLWHINNEKWTTAFTQVDINDNDSEPQNDSKLVEKRENRKRSSSLKVYDFIH